MGPACKSACAGACGFRPVCVCVHGTEIILGLYLVCGMPVLVDPRQARLARPLIGDAPSVSLSVYADMRATKRARARDDAARTHARTHGTTLE